MSVFSSGAAYRSVLRLLAVGHLIVGLGILWLMTGAGPFLFGYAYVGAVVLVGLIFLCGSMTPRFLSHPKGAAQGWGALFAIVVLGGVSIFGGGAIGRWMELRGALAENAGRTIGFAPGLATLALVATFILPLLIFLTARSAAHDAEAKTQESRESRTLSSDPDEKFLVLRIHRALLALCGVPMITSGVAIYLTSQRDPQIAALYAATNLMPYAMICAALCILIGGSFLTTRTLPRFVHRPTRWVHFPAIAFYITAASLVALTPLLIAAVPAMTSVQAGQSPVVFARYDFVQAGSMTTLISTVAFLGLIGTTIAVIVRKTATSASPDALRPYSSQRASDIPEVAPKKNMNKGKLPEPKLPSIGAAMKLYVIADWLVMRLLGLGMLGTAYILWQLIQDGRDYQAFQISYGQDPMYALYAYGAIGALMAVPYLLPRRITAPRHVFGGLIKAVLLAATAFILLPMLHVGIEMFTPEIYWATLHATAPSVFKALAGVAVTSALLISFFRQLGRTQQVDYSGKPVLVLSEQELRSLRSARMEN